MDRVYARQRNLTLDDLNRLRVFPFLDDQSKITTSTMSLGSTKPRTLTQATA